jgi:hypothetical protein
MNILYINKEPRWAKLCACKLRTFFFNLRSIKVTLHLSELTSSCYLKRDNIAIYQQHWCISLFNSTTLFPYFFFHKCAYFVFILASVAFIYIYHWWKYEFVEVGGWVRVIVLIVAVSFCWCMKREYPEYTPDLPQVTD